MEETLTENKRDDDKSKQLPVLQFNHQYMSNTKLGRILSTRDIDISTELLEFDLRISDKAVNLINVYADEHLTLTQTNVTPFDMAVLDSIYTIMSQGLSVVTPQWIVRVMSGNSRPNCITPDRVDRVVESIDKLRRIHLSIDCTTEYNEYQAKRKNRPVDSMKFESYLLPVEKIEARFDANGKRVIAYNILKKPALYEYAEMNKQIVKVPAELLESKDRACNSEEGALIRRYVVKRVAQIVKKNCLKANKVSFLWLDRNEHEQRGLFPELGYHPDGTQAWRKKKKRIVDVVRSTLDALVDKHAITRYEPYREDGTNNPASPIAGYAIYYELHETCLPT